MQRNFYTLVGIVVVLIMAIVFNISGTGPFTINLWRPVKTVLGLDLQGGARFLLKAQPVNGATPSDDAMAATQAIITSRVNGGFGVSEPQVQVVKSGKDRFISVEMPGLRKDLTTVERSLQQTGYLTLVALDTTQLPRGASTKGYRVLATGNDIVGNSLSIGTDQTGLPVVEVTLKDPGASNVSSYSSTHVGQYMGIAIDGKIYDAPVIQSPLGGSFQISNVGSYDNAKALMTTLKYGALPVSLKIVAVNDVSSTLGPSNVRASVVAGIVGLFIVMLFMLVYYRLPGLLADCALIIYALVVFALFKLIGVTLTLAGIAGFILSVGMAVDANILIFERMKEELRAGRSIVAATDAGFARAWPSIRDSNISTMITCAILYWFGTNFAASVIVGFASTLFIGVAISMLTAIVVSRTFLRLVLSGGRTATNRALFGAGV